MVMSISLRAATAALLLAVDPPGATPVRAGRRAAPATVIGSVVRLADLDLPTGPVDGEVVDYTLDVLRRWSAAHPAAAEVLADAVATDDRTAGALHRLAEHLREVGCWEAAELCYSAGLSLALARGAREDADRCRKGLGLVRREPTRTGRMLPGSAGPSIALLAAPFPQQGQRAAAEAGSVPTGSRGRGDDAGYPHLLSAN
jgi:hypothetical protein